MRLGQGVVWNDENLEKLRAMIADRMSGQQIADAIPGATRNAIVGKARRLGLNLLGQPANVPRRRRPQAPKPQGLPKSVVPDAKLPPAPIPEPDSLNLTLDGLAPGGCRFPTTGHDAPANGHRFCGAPADDGPYCPHHHRIATGGLPVKKKPALSVGR